MNERGITLTEIAGQSLVKVNTTARLRSMASKVNEVFYSPSRTVMLLFILVLFGILFNFGAMYLTILGINSGMMYEANPYAVLSWNVSFLEWGIFFALFIFVSVMARYFRQPMFNKAVFVVFLVLAGWLCFDFLHDLNLTLNLGIIHWRL